MTADGFSDLPAGTARTAKTILSASLSDHVLAFRRVKPRVVAAVKTGSKGPVDCPMCGEPSGSFGGSEVYQDGETTWHTGFYCGKCGFAYQE